VPWLLAAPAVAFVLAFLVVSSIAGAWYAFTRWNGINDPVWIGFGNFREIFSSDTARRALLHTVQLSVVFVVLVNAAGLLLALGLNRAVKSRIVLRAIFFLPVVIIPLATSYIWRFIFDYSGPLNGLFRALGLDSWVTPWVGDPTWALWTIVVVMVWNYTGLTMIIYLAGLQSIPDELVEASVVDGASAWTTFRRITAPLLAPAITINATLSLIIGLRAFDQVMALTGGGPIDASETLATQVYKAAFVDGRFGYGAALAVALTVLVLIVVLVQLVVLRSREARMGA
jgi:raffinose/stachyose/melibiose transport system permease protein